MRSTRSGPSASDLHDWLTWAIKIRFVLISFVFAIEYAIRVLALNPNSISSLRALGIAVILWYVFNLFFLTYIQLSRDYVLQAYLQIFIDLVIITAIVHVSGDLESNYFSLYPMVIILASILLPRARAFLIAAVSFVLMASLLELAYLPSLYPAYTQKYPAIGFLATASLVSVDLSTLQVKIFASLLGFFSVAYLSSYLADSLRRAGAELQAEKGQVANLQAINENIIQSMRDGLITTDLDGNITEVNPAGGAILGCAAGELRGKNIRTVFPDVAMENSVADDSSGPPIREEITYLHPGGEERILVLLASPLIGPERAVTGSVHNFQDITEDKRRESEYRAKDRMVTLGRVAAGIAHEIRNPLASISGSVKLLRSIASLDEDQAKLINIVSRESERLNKLVTDFLDYSRDQRFDFRQVDLVNVLEETLLLVEHHPGFASGCRLERKLPPHPVLVWADADKIRQVFWNICDNSLKAMPNGGTLTAEVQDGQGPASASRPTARVTISDTGIGLSPGLIERMFEPFQAGFAGGTGLGLAIVYQIVRGHHGRISVASAPGQGSKFVIELPRTPPHVP